MARWRFGICGSSLCDAAVEPVLFQPGMLRGQGFTAKLIRSQFLPAEMNLASALNGSAASAFCSAVKDLRVPNHLSETRTAAMVVRSWSAGDVCQSRTVLIYIVFAKVGVDGENANAAVANVRYSRSAGRVGMVFAVPCGTGVESENLIKTPKSCAGDA